MTGATAARAGYERAGPGGLGAAEERRRTESCLDLGSSGEVALGLLVALERRGDPAERPDDRPHTNGPLTASWPEKGAKS